MDSMFYGATDIGRRRENNEDAYLLEQNGKYVISVVADGIGGNEGGEVASYLACRCIAEYLRETSADDIGIDTLRQSVIYANNAIFSQHSNPSLYNMGCVLTAVLFDLEQNCAHMCHVGDTRLYQYKDGKLTKLSRDHSLVGEQEDAGLLTEEEAMHHPRRNIITKSVGRRQIDWGTDYIMTMSFPIQSDAQYLICSDGLYDMLPSATIADVLSLKAAPRQKVESLIRLANDAGGKDNITVVIIEFDIKKQSCRLSHLLRHDKSCMLEFGGWRPVNDIIIKTGLSFEDLYHIVTTDKKGRFEFNGDKTKVRALYGHSVSVDMDYACSVPPKTLFHGTSKNADIAILNGLIPRARNYVHLSTDCDAAANTGARHGFPVVIQIDAGKMVEEGYEFYNPIGDIWLVREVPSRFYNQFFCPFSHDGQTETCLERKAMKIVCDSHETIETIKKDNIISSMCEFEHLSNTSFTLQTLGDWLDRQIYIVAITDDRKCDNDLLSKLTGFQHLCQIILISPRIANDIPDIYADNVQDIQHALRSFCLLVQGGLPMPIDSRDAQTLLFRGSGEIKFLCKTVKTNSDIVEFWNDLGELIEGRNCNMIIHMALSEENKKLEELICSEFANGLNSMHNQSSEADICYGYSYNQKIDSDNIYVSAFIRYNS